MEFEKILEFWFEELKYNDWFKKNKEVDELIRERFLGVYSEITSGQYQDWKENPKSLLAMVLVLDQFSRNMFRDSEQMYFFDMMALNLTKLAIDKGFDLELTLPERSFLYMPLMHSENLEDQKACVKLFQFMMREDKKYEMMFKFARRHMKVIEEFGRFPHRNEILERKSTASELEFLSEPNSGF